MCFGGGSPPNAVATAQAQAGINRQSQVDTAQINNINQTNPLGSVNYTGTPGQPDYQQTTTLNPDLQSILSRLTSQGVNVANQIPAVPFSLSSLAGGADVSQDYAPVQSSFNQGGGLQYNIADAGGIQRGLSNAGSIQNAINYNPNIQTGVNQDFGSQLNSSRNAAYNSQAQYLDPRFARSDQALSSQLAAQGIPVGSEAYNSAMAQQNESKNQAYQGAQDSATLAGNQLQNQLFGQSLAGGQFANQAQQQSYGQALGTGAFGNEAQQQYFSQLADSGNFANSAQGQQFAQNAAQQQAYNSAAGQDYAQNQGAAQFANQANQQKFDMTQNLRTEGINEQQLVNNAPINELMALLNGTSISNINFQPHNMSTAAQAAPDAVGLAAGNYAAQQAKQAALLGAIGSAFGAAGSAAVMKCWVAREVYGVKNPRWLRFRVWLDTKAPRWLDALYVKYGERFAVWLHDKPRVKTLIRRWMDARIAHV